MTKRKLELCSCGQPLHYPNALTQAYMLEQVRRFGGTVIMRTTEGSWRVPRHYYVLHGIRPWELPELAAQYAWEAVADDEGEDESDEESL